MPAETVQHRAELTKRQAVAWRALGIPSTPAEWAAWERDRAAGIPEPTTRLMFGGAKGGGKQLALNTPIPTTTGWTTIGAIAAGDYVLDDLGQPVQVVAVTDTEIADAYAVRFDTGETIIADGRHLWRTYTARERATLPRLTDEYRTQRRASRPTRGTGARPDLAARNAACATATAVPPADGGIRTTQEIMETLVHSAGCRQTNHAVAVARPLDLPAADLRIEPYLLGLWLGDGYTDTGCVGCAETDLDEMLPHIGRGIVSRRREQGRQTPFASVRFVGLQADLRSMGLLGNKRIPQEYLRASHDQRLALLQGIMDTDGTADERGQCEILLTCRPLIDDIHELLCTLGIKGTIRTGRATIKGRHIGDKYRIKFVSPLPVFRLPRKLARQKREHLRPSTGRRFIVSVEPVGKRAMRCIQVADERGMYLAGRSMIPTHNSYLLCLWVLNYALQVIRHYGLGRRENPIPLGFIGRKRATDFNDTTLDTWKQTIPPAAYTLHAQKRELVIGNSVRIDFGGLDDQAAISKFNSAEYAFLAIDQAEETSRDDVSVLMGSLRRKINGRALPYRQVYTANPRQCWLRKEFITAPEPGSRFVPSLPGDNPHLPAGYLDQLQTAFRHRPELLQAYLYGSWDAFDDPSQTIKSQWVTRALGVRLLPQRPRKLLVCDPARMGDDETVIYMLEGTRIIDKLIVGQRYEDWIAGELARRSRDAGGCLVAIDSIGVGGGVATLLVSMGVDVLEINSAGGPAKPDEYVNIRAEMWWEVARMFERGDVDGSGIDDADLQDQLSTPTYDFRGKRILIESKEDIKSPKRLGRSPDRADAYVMGLYAQEVMAGRIMRGTGLTMRAGKAAPVAVPEAGSYLDLQRKRQQQQQREAAAARRTWM